MTSLLHVKRISATAFALSFFLPLASCNNADLSAYSAYPWPSIEGLLAVLLFFWPLALEVISASNLRYSAPRTIAQLTMCAVSLLFVLWLAGWGQVLRYGTAVATLAIIGYASATLTCHSPVGNRRFRDQRGQPRDG